jgi:hypothetical protein
MTFLSVDQCFSTFFLTRGTLNIRKNLAAPALIQRQFFKKDLGKSLYCNKNAFFSPKRIVKVMKNKSSAHLEGTAHRLRETLL